MSDPAMDQETGRRLQGQIALITGAGRGIGQAIAIRYALEGASLVLTARTRSELEQTAEAARQAGADASFMPGDVSDRDQVVAVVADAIRRHGRIDVLVNAAGIYGPIGPVWEVEPQLWKRAVDVNLFGTFLVCQAVVPHMLRQGSGRIINFSGGGATAPLPRFSAYGVSKAAVVRLTETLAEELKEHGVSVNAIAPGAVDTRLQDEVLQAGARAGDLHARIHRMRESGEGGTPIEVPAELAVFLAGEASHGLTGRLIAAPYDDWEHWDAVRIAEVMSKPWFTLRRLDPHTVNRLMEQDMVARGKK